jgi:hypothetical protein
MKKSTVSVLAVLLFTVSGLFLLNLLVSGQETSKASPSLPDDINKIVTASCMPCHTSKGGMMSRGKLNFTEWTQYSPSKQKEKADKMVSVIKKGKMPPKSATETRPDIIPTSDQVAVIKKWAESLSDVSN